MKKRGLFLAAVLLSLLFADCDNFFHELVPPDGNRIEDFSVPGLLSVEIGDTAIIAYVQPGTELTALIPSIRVSSGATLVPVTSEYISRAFDDERTFGAAMELNASGNRADKVVEMIRANKNFTRPVLDMPVNFSYPVDFLVISGLGTIRQYTVRVEIDTGEGRFKSFKFEKFFNPEIVRTTTGVIDNGEKTVTIDVYYPVEYTASYQLTPTFETNGARVYLDGAEWKSGETLVGFSNNAAYSPQTKTLTLKRAGFPDTEWTLTVNFKEDPNTSRSITDFRFTKALNPLIAADYMAEEIVNSGDTGTITVNVYYQGARPDTLRASFVSTGNVTVDGEPQISGYTPQDFSASVSYVVTSRVGNNFRTYTVTVNLVPASDPLPQITYFGFNAAFNPALVSDSMAMIDHNSRLILIEAAYDGETLPVNLIPDFTATGTVTVNGVTQTGGSSRVQFSGPVVYTVSHSLNPLLKREYRVEVKFVRSLSSAAEITAFTFYQADNPDLIADVHATVNQATGRITATLLFETPGGDRTLVPRWSAQGRVESNGVTQTSGAQSRQFYTPQIYGVVSADSGFRKDYTVTVKEVNSRIHVKHDATGRNDGTNWKNAYRSLSDATDDANLFPGGRYWEIIDETDPNMRRIDKEIWIAEGTYSPRESHTEIRSLTSFIGGFRGYEASKEARADPANHRPVITGDQGGGRRLDYFLSIQDWFSTDAVCSFEDLVITCFATDAGSSNPGILIGAGSRGKKTVIVKGVEFSDLMSRTNGSALCLMYCDVIMTDCSFSNINSGGGGAVTFDFCKNVTISGCRFTNTRTVILNSISAGGGAITFLGSGYIVMATVINCVFTNTFSENNLGHAIMCLSHSEGDFTLTESGNTFENVPQPRISYRYE